MKYRIEPKPERKSRFRAYLETDDLAAVRAWVAHPPVPVKTRIRGTDGTYHQLATPSYHDIIVSVWELAPGEMDDKDNIPRRWMESRDVSTVASMETAAGCRQIEVWNGEPAGTRKPREAYDR
jgi:hypothetical protein